MKEQEHIYWVGPRKSDIAHVKDIDFFGSVTIFGDGKDNNYAYCLSNGQTRVNHNVPDKAEDKFFFDTIVQIIGQDPKARFYFYNPQSVYYIDGLKAYKQYFLNVNEEPLMMEAVNKSMFNREMMGHIPLLDKMELNRSNCDYGDLVNKFRCDVTDNRKFIFQAIVSSGGNGTFLVEKDSVGEVVNLLSSNPKDKYLVSVYQEKNIPVNIHAVIFSDKILLSPGSVQIMKEDDHRLLYRGADFVTYQKIDEKAREEFEKYVRTACEIYQKRGYRGVCGIDGIVCEDGVKILELNNRFQASTGLVNLALEEAGLPSVHRINLAAFNGTWDERFWGLQTLAVNYSNFFYTDNGTKFHSDRVRTVCRELINKNDRTIVALEDDGYDPQQMSDSLGYLFRMTLRGNITSINPEKQIWLNENICEPNKKLWYERLRPAFHQDIFGRSAKEIRDYLLYLKIALLTQGVVIRADAEKLITERGGLRPATNNAVDLKLTLPTYSPFWGRREKYLIINAPTDINFVAFSPFEIILDEGGELCLTYYGERIPAIKLDTYKLDPVAVIRENCPDGSIKFTDKTTRSGVLYKEIAFLSTDRLRVHLTNSCIFKAKDGRDLGCQFCNIAPSHGPLEMDDVEEVIKDYCEQSADIGLTHFLIGGQTAPDDRQNQIIKIIKTIRQNARFAPIYAMVIPYSEQTIRSMYEAGLNELSFNIEVFHDEIALKYMPGKRLTPYKTYLARLKYATKFFGRQGNVRSMVIVGLEPYQIKKEEKEQGFTDFISGIKEFAEAGIQPILSVFRPLPETPLADLQAPPMLYLVNIYNEVQRICREHGLNAGPNCVNCQNNTLALPIWLEDAAEAK